MSDSLRVVDFPIGLFNYILNLRNTRQMNFMGEIHIREAGVDPYQFALFYRNRSDFS